MLYILYILCGVCLCVCVCVFIYAVYTNKTKILQK